MYSRVIFWYMYMYVYACFLFVSVRECVCVYLAVCVSTKLYDDMDVSCRYQVATEHSEKYIHTFPKNISSK